MNNYSIDASVYACQENIPVKDYIKTVIKLYNLICEDKPRDKRYYLFEKDIEFLRNNNLDFAQLNLNSLPKKKPFDYIQELLNIIYDKVLSNSTLDTHSTKIFLSKYISFEKWFNIIDINFNSPPILSPDLSEEINNINLKTNLKKNIAIIEALNKYVYKNTEIHKIISSMNEVNDISITTDYDIILKKSSYINTNGETQYYTHRIKNLPRGDPAKKEIVKIQINNQIVKNSTLATLLESNANLQLWDNWENKFSDYIEFGPECRVGIKQYLNKIELEKAKILDERKLFEIEKWLKQLPNVLYENLKALQDCLHIIKKPEGLGYDERYNDNCNSTCERYLECASYFRLFGLDCVNDREKNKNNLFMLQDRIKKSLYGEKIEFWHHLRIYSYKCYNDLWFLSLRLYFRWISSNRIEIGWIGRHLYQPCERRNKESNKIIYCEREKDCPRNQKCSLHNTNISDYDNFLKQWL